ISILSTPAKTLSPYVNLLDSQKQKAVTIPKSGVLISEKLASYYHVKAGDVLWLRDNGLENDKIKLKVKQVIDMTVGHYLIMSDTY
ncbi:hypothetical protein ACXWOK_09805, partial [Streptococcus pyogenes]